jgi:hypothetical protein
MMHAIYIYAVPRHGCDEVDGFAAGNPGALGQFRCDGNGCRADVPRYAP